MSDCKGCDGSGIMFLYASPGNRLKAPCLMCSPTRTLEDLEDELHRKIAASETLEGKRQIKEHNQRMQGL